MRWQFRSFRQRLLIVLLGLVGGAQLAAFFIVARVHRANAEAEMQDQLARAADYLLRSVAQRNADLARSARALAFDDGLRSALATTRDPATLVSALTSFQGRVDADVVALLSLDGALLAETPRGTNALAAYRTLQQTADQAETPRATGYALLDGTLTSITVVPMQAPDIVAWVAIGFRLDQRFLDALKRQTGVDIELSHGGHVLTATATRGTDFAEVHRSLRLFDRQPVDLALRYSRLEKLAAARAVERTLWAIFAGSLLLATLAALWISRGVSRPVQALAAHTRRIAAGDYTTRVDLSRTDELGQLAAAFNVMAGGLEERDRVRDLLDKNVSPEVAAQMLRDGAALGGEEREVTVLFADLRGFTALSESLPPPALLSLLNRYLDAMSAAIEREGGVIDKFIGDAVMALFGAPVPQPDAADRALRAALGMRAALAALNETLVNEGRAPLACGIGVNTARVVAGNIGSHRRLNYSVIGDGVNVASRLQTLTRSPEYATNIITSKATVAALRAPATFHLRDLGTATVKGRAEPIALFALD